MGSARALAVGTVVLVLGFGAGVVLSTKGSDTSAGTPAVEGESALSQTPPTSRDPAPWALGDRVRSGGLQLILQAVSDPFEGADPVVTAPAGKRWVAADIEITSLSGAPMTLAHDQFVLRDPADASYEPATTAEDLPPVAGVLRPGETRRGTVVFEAPEDARHLRLVFSAAPGTAPPIVVSLG
jgi:hypothetical protein